MKNALRSYLERLVVGAHPLEIIFRILVANIGTLLLAVCLWLVAGNIYVLQTYEHAEAEVISSERIGPPSRNLNRFGVQVRYFLPDGKKKTASVTDATTKFEVGEIIDVYYQPDTDYKVIAGGFQQMWFHITIIGAVSLVLLFFGLRPYPPRPS